MGQQRKSDRKFFPGYVLVQMELTDETWHLVKETPKVLGFIGGTSDRPAPISDKEANAILNKVEDGVNKPRPKFLLKQAKWLELLMGHSRILMAASKKLIMKKASSKFPC
jgi:transcriptional antiterminator NusG